jgi:GDP-L-fucose synthase
MSGKIFVAGQAGMVGSAIVRQLLMSGHPEDTILVRTRQQLDLTDQASVRDFLILKSPIRFT